MTPRDIDRLLEKLYVEGCAPDWHGPALDAKLGPVDLGPEIIWKHVVAGPVGSPGPAVCGTPTDGPSVPFKVNLPGRHCPDCRRIYGGAW